MPISAEYVKSKIDAVRQQIGRTVTFYVPTPESDYTASGFYDPVTDTSFIKTFVTVDVLARIHWAGDERINASPAGKYYIGDCTLGIDPGDALTAQAAMAEGGKVIVDGREMQVIGLDPVGAPTINRYRVVCKSSGVKPTL